MNVEREIAGFALPFAAGVLAAAYTGVLFCGDSTPVNIIAFSAICISVCLLLQRENLCLKEWIIWTAIGAGAIGCGLLSGITAQHLFETPETGLHTFTHNINLKLQSAIDALPFSSNDSKALIKALLTGEKASLSPQIKEAFRSSGASHILALSGLHIGIIYSLLSMITSLAGNSKIMRIIRSVTIICICGLYTMATGAGDSLVRAFLFIILGETAKLTGRYHGLGQIMLASLVIQLVIFPEAIKSIGFQLSYAAMAGIAFIYPWLKGFWDSVEKFFKGKLKTLGKPFQWVWNSVALSIACQITTGPLAYMYFGTFPTYFILTNLLALPLTGILIPAALLTILLSGIGWCPGFVATTTEFLIRLLIRTLEIISAM